MSLGRSLGLGCFVYVVVGLCAVVASIHTTREFGTYAYRNRIIVRQNTSLFRLNYLLRTCRVTPTSTKSYLYPTFTYLNLETSTIIATHWLKAASFCGDASERSATTCGATTTRRIIFPPQKTKQEIKPSAVYCCCAVAAKQTAPANRRCLRLGLDTIVRANFALYLYAAQCLASSYACPKHSNTMTKQRATLLIEFRQNKCYHSPLHAFDRSFRQAPACVLRRLIRYS